jgi:hypothetical protein
MVSGIIYSLCGLTSLFCAWLLLRAYREKRIGLLLWVGLFFVIQACANVILVIDKVMIPHFELSMLRYMIVLIGVGVLLYGLIMRTEVD